MRRPLALGLIALGVSLMLAAALFVVLDPGGPASEAQFGSESRLSLALFLLPCLSFFTVGSLLALRQPQSAVGWLCLAIGLTWLTTAATGAAAEWAFHSRRRSLAEWLGVFGALWVPAIGLMTTHLPLRLPGGSHLSRAWQRYSRFCTLVIVVIAVPTVTQPGPVNGIPGSENPLASPALQALEPLFVLLPLSFLGAVVSLVLRYRRSGGVQRLQIRTIAFGGLIFLAVFISSLGNLVGLFPSGGAAEETMQNLALVSYNALPVAIGVAVFRYRLYDIDVVINRALVYGAVTATLAVAYLASVLLLQFAVSPLTERSDLAVAGSTLVVAALFRPVRARIQASVDRRFYRSRYDAARTLEGFSGRLREQLDLEALSTDLRGVVRETMQPTHLSLWLRP